MGLFRRKETLNERLLREAGLDAAGDPVEPLVSAPSHGLATAFGGGVAHGPERPRQWDAFVTVDAPGIDGGAAEFTTLPDGSLIVADDDERELSPLADAVERRLQPPYRARAVRQGGSLWAVTANGIDVVPLRVDGDVIDLAMRDGERSALVDGEPTTRAFAELERLGEREAPDYAIRAERLEGDLFEVQVHVL